MRVFRAGLVLFMGSTTLTIDECPLSYTQLVQLLLLLALLSFQDYVVSTWGPWLIAITLLVSPFWFNPQTFSLTKTTVRCSA